MKNRNFCAAYIMTNILYQLKCTAKNTEKILIRLCHINQVSISLCYLSKFPENVEWKV